MQNHVSDYLRLAYEYRIWYVDLQPCQVTAFCTSLCHVTTVHLHKLSNPGFRGFSRESFLILFENGCCLDASRSGIANNIADIGSSNICSRCRHSKVMNFKFGFGSFRSTLDVAFNRF